MIDSKEKLKGFLMELLFSEGAARKEILEEDPDLHEGSLDEILIALLDEEDKWLPALLESDMQKGDVRLTRQFARNREVSHGDTVSVMVFLHAKIGLPSLPFNL